MSNNVKRVLCDVAGLLFCLAPPCIVTVQYFPLWRETIGFGAVAGGGFAIIAVIVFAVLGRYLRTRIKSPSPVIVFLILYTVLVVVEKVVSGLKVIAFWGVIGAAAGAVFFWLADKYKKESDE